MTNRCGYSQKFLDDMEKARQAMLTMYNTVRQAKKRREEILEAYRKQRNTETDRPDGVEQ